MQSATDYFIDVCETHIMRCEQLVDSAAGYDDDDKADAKRGQWVNMQAVAFAVREGL